MIPLFYVSALAAMFFIAAGTIRIPSAWITLGTYFVLSIINLFLVDPDLITERLQMGGEGVSRTDQALASASTLFVFPFTLILAGLDIGRFHWTQNYSLILQLSSFILFVLGKLLANWAAVSNKYFSTFVRIQEDRNHQVATGGPYKHIRHPGYAGTIIMAIALPLALGSVYALVPASIGCVGFLVRTAIEDNELKRRLEGYDEYALKVRYRLLTGVW